MVRLGCKRRSVLQGQMGVLPGSPCVFVLAAKFRSLLFCEVVQCIALVYLLLHVAIRSNSLAP